MSVQVPFRFDLLKWDGRTVRVAHARESVVKKQQSEGVDTGFDCVIILHMNTKIRRLTVVIIG